MDYTQDSGFILTEAPEGFLQVSPSPDQQELEEYYHNKYYQMGLGSYEVEYSEKEFCYFKNRLNRHYALVSKHLSADSNPTMLDIGCGEGFTSSYFVRKGFKVASIDYSSAGIAKHNPDLLDNHETGDLYQILNTKVQSKQKYDLLILQNVLEHVAQPIVLSDIMQQLLNSSGIALITVPNDFSMTQVTALQEGYIKDKFWVSPPDHLNYFNTDTILTFLQANGWVTLDMITDFPVDWFLFHDGSNYIKDLSKGKQAHYARISIENMLHQATLDKVINFYKAAAALGIGRDVTVIVRPKIQRTFCTNSSTT